MEDIKLGRNDPCHCGSGKKYMHCCRRTDLKAKAARRAAEPPKPDLSEPLAQTEPVSPERPLPPEPPISPPPDPRVQAFNARWEDFKARDYEHQIALFLQTLGEEELMDAEMAFEKKIGIQFQKTFQRRQVLFFIRQPVREKRAAEILTEKH